MNDAGRSMSVDRAREVPPVIDVATAAAMLGIGKSAAYELIRTGEWPTPVLHLGKSIRIPSRPVLELIHVQR
jgi:predicted DNA-binding transcriptional regulator AlpA